MRKSYRVKKESEFQRVFETHNSVVIARSAADGLSMAETKKNLVHVLKRAHLLDEKSED